MITRKGFTLIELLIVIVIVGVVYKLALTTFSNIKQPQKEKSLNLADLKEQLLKYDFDEEIRVVCFNECSTCKILVDNNKEITIKPFIKKKLQVYRYDYELHDLREDSFEPYFDDKKVEHKSCFSLRVFQDGSSQQLLVYDGEKLLWFGDYFQTKVYDSLEDFKKYKEELYKKALL